MAFSGGTFSRLYDWTTDRDNGVKILASRMDQEFDGMATGLSTCILKDGTQTCTAAIPFAEGLTVPDNKTIILGTNSDITIQYDESTNDSLEIAANVEGAALGIVLKADQGDDNADQHKVGIADGGTLTMASKISGSFVSYLTHTPNSTVASSTTAVAGNLTVGGDLTLGSGAVISEAELETIDGITPGTAAASKAMVLDASLDISGGRNLTISGELDAATLDVSGDVDIDGTLEADAITVNGTALNTVIAGVTVTDATNSAHVLVTDNESTNEENLITFVEDATSSTGNVGLEMDGNLTYNPSTGTVTATVFKGNIDAVDGDFDGTLEADAMTLNGTAITATATLDTGISNNNVPKFTSGVADDDFLRVDGTAIEGRSAAEVLSDIAAAPAAGSSNIVTTGALNSGSITSGFGAIDNGASAITTTGVITGGTVEATADTSAGDNAAIGYTAAEGLILTGQGSTSDITLKNDADATVFTVPTGTDDILFPDNAKAMFGAGSDLQIYHDGSNSFIDDAGTGNVFLRGSSQVIIGNMTGEQAAVFNDNGAVTINYDNAQKLATTNTGVDVTGGFTATAASTITTSDNSNNLTLTSTDADANTGPNLVMTRASGSPADNDAIGELTFNFNNDAAENTVGTRWRNFIIDASDGTEDAAFDIFSIKAGALTSIINYDASTLSFNDGSADIDFRVESDNNANALFVQGSSGNVGIGTASPAQLLHVNNSGGDAAVQIQGNTRSFKIEQNNYGLRISDVDAGSERIRLDASGSVLLGTTNDVIWNAASGEGIVLYQGKAFQVARNNDTCVLLNRQGSDGSIQVFARGGTQVGRIDVTASATSYVTSSDRRLKSNIEDAASASDKIDAIQVRQFDWNVDNSHQEYGLIAQELQPIEPLAVSGNADSDEMMGVDYSKLVPMLIKEIQELRGRVAALEAN